MKGRKEEGRRRKGRRRKGERIMLEGKEEVGWKRERHMGGKKWKNGDSKERGRKWKGKERKEVEGGEWEQEMREN